MIISCSEIEIILNELLARKKEEISLLSIYGPELLFNYNLENQKLYLKTTRSSWRTFIQNIVRNHSLTNYTEKELPQFDDIIKSVTSAGISKPEGIDVLIEEINNYLAPVKRMNRRKRFLIALDTNQLIDNLMSSYIENEFSAPINQQVRNFISYVISSWVLYERDSFLRREKNRGIKELNEKFSDFEFYLPEKIDRMARLGYSIYSELKSLEESYDQLESKLSSTQRFEILKEKNLKDQAIIDEYDDYKKSLKDVKFVFVTSDDQAYALAKDRFESVKIKVQNKIPNVLDCIIENGASLIYQLTLFLGFLRINNYNIKFSIHFSGKEHHDWETKRLKFECSDRNFEERITNIISLTRKLNSINNS